MEILFTQDAINILNKLIRDQRKGESAKQYENIEKLEMIREYLAKDL